MAEQFGALLQELRITRGWSLGQLARQAGVSKSALSQWESGLRQPRMPELEATLRALNASSGKRARLLACVEAPRAIRYLQTPEAHGAIGPPPTAGDLLRALRLRGGWTQEEVAGRAGVRQNTVARWEQSERRPSSEQMQALCFALEAREEEILALTTGRFAETPTQLPTEPRAVLDSIHSLLFNPREQLADLRFLTIERTLWQRATQNERIRPLLATAYAEHAHYLSLFKRWEETETMAKRALALTPQQSRLPTYTLRAVLKLAAAQVFGGHRAAPERGMNLLLAWLPASSEPDFTGWFLSDIAKYMTMTENRTSAVELGKRAIRIAEGERLMRRLDYGGLLLAIGQPAVALDQLPGLSEEHICFVHEALIRAKAYCLLNEPSAAHDLLQRAYAVIEAQGLTQQRREANELAKRF